MSGENRPMPLSPTIAMEMGVMGREDGGSEDFDGDIEEGTMKPKFLESFEGLKFLQR
jgi:hypothetical protein